MHPGILLPDVDHGHEVGVQAAIGRGHAEGVLMQVRRAGGHHDPIKLVLLDIGADQLLAGSEHMYL